MITRDRALELLKKHLKNRNLFKHCLAVEAVMRELAKKFGEDEELWGLTGLLHDLDYDYTKNDPEKHGLVTLELLKDEDVPQEMLDGILAHCGKKERNTLIEKAIYPADPVTGFIVAAALIRPEKKLEVVDVQFLKRRFKEKAFAKGANREQIKACEKIGMTLDEFLELSLNAMKKISAELGL
ncbi:MAG: HDIG domain-containing protein [Thermotogaceae bacterium]|nr:HDIG domain-containing protein [Thermotogaceae bacterium]